MLNEYKESRRQSSMIHERSEGKVNFHMTFKKHFMS